MAANTRAGGLARLRAGLRVGWLEEKSLRQWTAVNVLNVIACLLLGLEPLAMALLVALGGLVLITELLNVEFEERGERYCFAFGQTPGALVCVPRSSTVISDQATPAKVSP